MTKIQDWLNAFLSKDTILSELGPVAIVKERGALDHNIKRKSFGSYVLSHMETTNRMDTRAVSAIALNRANDFGGYYFFSLDTGKIIHTSQ